MVSRIQANKPIKGMTGMDINVKVIRIIDLAKESIKTGRTIKVGDNKAIFAHTMNKVTETDFCTLIVSQT